MTKDLSGLKKHVFFELLDMAGRVFIHVSYSDDVIIGNRGFLEEEKENGLILVFNAGMKFEWNKQGIAATLGFGTRAEECFIPQGSIASIFSPELDAQFSVSPAKKKTVKGKAAVTKTGVQSREKVIKVDFGKKTGKELE